MKEKLTVLYNVKIIKCFFILFPIIELITSITKFHTSIDITIGSIYKFIFVIYALVYIFCINNKGNKKLLVFYSILTVYSLFNLVITTTNMTTFLLSLEHLNKLLTFVTASIFFYLYMKNGNKLNLNIITYVALIYVALINIANWTGSAIATYEGNILLGSTGWYYSANELNVLLIMFLLVTLYNSMQKPGIINVLTLLLTATTLLSIGSKTSVIAMLIALIAVFIYSIIYYLIKRTVLDRRLLILTIMTFLLVLIIMPYTASYSHLIKRVNENFSEKLDIEQNISNIDGFLYNGRENYLKEQKELYNLVSITEKLFGLKYENKIKNTLGTDTKLIEIDFFDIVINYGIVGFILFYLPIMLTFINLLYNVIKKQVKEMNSTFLCFTTLVIVLGISCLAGHVMLSTSITILFALILAVLYSNPQITEISNLSLSEDVSLNSGNNKKRMLICTQRISIGGMERAFINILNLSNFTKNYEVWGYVAYVKDKAYLNNLPKSVKLHIVCNKSWNAINKIVSAVNMLFDILTTPKFDVAICYRT